MEIMRFAGVEPGEFQPLDPLGSYMHGSMTRLGDSFHQKERFADDGQAPGLEEIWSHDDIRNPGFILETDEADAFGGSRTLATDHLSGNTHTAPIGNGSQFGGGPDSGKARAQ